METTDRSNEEGETSANDNEDTSSLVPSDDRPIVCVLEDPRPSSLVDIQTAKRQRCRMFRVIRSKGKALASGGFGVTVLASGTEDDDDEEEEENDVPETDKSAPKYDTKTSKESAEYLFIEEVLFLHEKGLLRAMIPSTVDVEGDLKSPSMNRLDTSQLYQMLPSMGVSLAVYRVYSHLRSQDFRVLRHDPNRYEILCQQREDQEERKRKRLERQQKQEQEQHTENGKDGSSMPPKNARKQSIKLRRRVRLSIQNAPPPTIPFPNSESSMLGICWDAYSPNTNFGKTHPGLPDFYVTATFYNVPTVTFSDLMTVLREHCNGIPLKVATVSDSGTVAMFGVTDYGIPSLAKSTNTATKE